jgi:bifunctional non-homologous end joining protein LigD
VLSGARLHGKFTLVRLRPKPNQRGSQDNWLLIKGHDANEQPGADATALENAVPPPAPTDNPPIPGAIRGTLPEKQAPQLAAVADGAPEEPGWLSEIKFDGYRLLIFLDNGHARVMTRNGQDWTDRLPAVASAAKRLHARTALVDGELVALDDAGRSSFALLQQALSDGRDERLFLYLFDLLHLDGWNLRGCALRDRREALRGLDGWRGMLRFSDHHEGDTARMRQAACRMHLEGIICKRADAPYRPGRSHDWLKVKCSGREDFVILGWTEPAGSRTGLGALHLGFYDQQERLHYVGGCGTGFSDETLSALHEKLTGLASRPPKGLMLAGEDLDRTIHWVRPALVAETSFVNFTAAGRLRHAVFLGLNEDKSARDVVRDSPTPAAELRAVDPKPFRGTAPRTGPSIAIPPKHPLPPARSSRIVTAKAPGAKTEQIEGVTLTHPDRDLWPGISKRDLLAYWQAVADSALRGVVRRPLAVLRCPEGVAGEHFFQKHAHGAMPDGVREDVAGKAPYLAIDGMQGVAALVQMSAIELHVWGASEDDPLMADQLVFDLDPGEGVTVPDLVAAAHTVRERLETLGLAAFCRTSGGKGLHVVVPLKPEADWDAVRPFCHRFAEAISQAEPDRYLAHVRIADRKGRILIDWLRNGLGSTAVASFCPRARPGAGVATPLAWREVTPKLDLAAFTLRTVPDRLRRLKADPWEGFEQARRTLPTLPEPERKATITSARIVTAKAPSKRR